MNHCKSCLWLTCRFWPADSCSTKMGYTEETEACGEWLSLKQVEADLRQLWDQTSSRAQRQNGKGYFKDENWTWLEHFSFSQAFAICIGAGPWKEGRRETVQKAALEGLGDRDICAIVGSVSQLGYPLDWQIEIMTKMTKFLSAKKMTMEQLGHAFFRQPLDEDRKALLQDVRAYLGESARAKVVQLWFRDALQIESFPIDRHVARALVSAGLPLKQEGIIDLCNKLGINPRYLSRVLFSERAWNPVHAR